MAKKCIYCSGEVPDEAVIDFCDTCGKNVWGEKMFNAIVQNMENARENGDLNFNSGEKFEDSA
jgi:uncharacterized protein with PIN domain